MRGCRIHGPPSLASPPQWPRPLGVDGVDAASAVPTVNLGRNVDLREALSQVAIDGENQGVAMGTPKCGHAECRMFVSEGRAKGYTVA